MKDLPDLVAFYKRSADFTETTIPNGLLSRHTTKAGVWARIRVLEGSLLYRILSPALEEHVLTREHCGIVEPQVAHEIAPLGPVRFYVEFLR